MKEHLSKDDWADWLSMPQTQALFQAIRNEQQEAVSWLVRSVDMDSLKQSKYIGIMSGLQKVLDFTYDDGQPN